MKQWPVPKSYNKKIPNNNESGSFWENRNDRYHCGVDIYAPKLSEVKSVENGRIINFGKFTSSDIIIFWFFFFIISK